MLLRKTPVALALASLAASAFSQTGQSADAPLPLSAITVSATRTERTLDSVPNTVTVLNTKDLQRINARDLKGLFDDEVDLAVRSQSMRFTTAGASTGRGGNEGINIRGLEGNQVLMMVDDIRLPLSWSFGPFASGRGDYIEVDTLANAEVLRGPASAQFGSDGLAGALSLNTLSPEDLLKGGKSTGGFVSTGYDSTDSSWKATAGVATTNGDWQGMAVLTHRQGHETKNMGDNDGTGSTRTAPNPSDFTSDNLLAKASYRANAQHRLLATLELHRMDRDTDVLSGRSSTITAMDGSDKVERHRFSLEDRYEDLNAPWLQSLRTKVYVQYAKTDEFTAEANSTGGRSRDTWYREEVIGLSTQAQTQLSGQRLSYGLDISDKEVSGLRDGTPAGTSFPSKYFPDTSYVQAGAFVQDEIEAGNFSIIPGARYEYYSLKPDSTGYSGTAVSLSDKALTPRLGLIWRASASLQPYAQWAQGFKAPTPDQVNGNYSSTNSYYYQTIGNSNLKAEHANSFELGLRGQLGNSVRWQLSAYHNRYKDFISQETIGGSINSPSNPQTYQYINLAKARIKGVEARADWQISPQLSLKTAIAHASGESTEDGVSTPLDSVQPTRATLGARYDTGSWDLQAKLQYSAAKKASDISQSSYYATPSYATLDLSAGYRFSPTLSMTAGISNLTDKKYWRWSDARGITANTAASIAVLDAYTAPGRSFQMALRADF
jgi:hemoglobin/transferrin/lactoferrin receptor protein